jgi:ABC-type multidrug transport system ATPase subunit
LTGDLQDPLSALDAHVGRTVFQRVFMNNPEGRTKILVTHALHFLPQVDYIYTIADGQVMERGTYVELMANRGVFSKFVKEFGSKQQQEDETDEAKDGVEVVKKEKNEKRPDTADLKEEYEKGKTIMQEEERNIGAVTWETYKEYLTSGNGYILIPTLLLALLLVQGTQVMSSYWLVFWQEQQFHQPAGFYVRDRIHSSPNSRSS